jgi:hypothetical protein
MNPAILVGAGVVALGATAAFAIPNRRVRQEPQSVGAETVAELVAL